MEVAIDLRNVTPRLESGFARYRTTRTKHSVDTIAGMSAAHFGSSFTQSHVLEQRRLSLTGFQGKTSRRNPAISFSSA
ncbi:MAG TPA: hypothetical protein VF534_31140 [Paraburkholderia sp.]